MRISVFGSLIFISLFNFIYFFYYFFCNFFFFSFTFPKKSWGIHNIMAFILFGNETGTGKLKRKTKNKKTKKKTTTTKQNKTKETNGKKTDKTKQKLYSFQKCATINKNIVPQKILTLLKNNLSLFFSIMLIFIWCTLFL